MPIMSTNVAWKHEYDVKLWRHKQRTPNANDHHMPLKETPPMKIFWVRHCFWHPLSLQYFILTFDASSAFCAKITRLSHQALMGISCLIYWTYRVSLISINLSTMKFGDRPGLSKTRHLIKGFFETILVCRRNESSVSDRTVSNHVCFSCLTFQWNNGSAIDKVLSRHSFTTTFHKIFIPSQQ